MVLTVHVAIAAFVVLGLLAILAGHWLRPRVEWRWIDAVWFRGLHLATIGCVAAEAWLGLACPLTTLESWLRRQARQDGYRTGFIEYWLQRLLYYDAPPWLFTLGYTLFALAVVAVWWRYPPRPSSRPSPRPPPRQRDG
ncbi:MAG: DUF2784 domain-containing protein [Lautropia sp.]